MKRTLYFAKEPFSGIRNDLYRLSKIYEEFTIVDCLNVYCDYYHKRGYNCISLSEFFKLDKSMLFDYILGNPPFSNTKTSGNKNGSSTNPLWWEITIKSLSLLKPGGEISLITPTNMVNGGNVFTKLTLGSDRKYDLKKIDFSVDDEFNVGIPLCRWVINNELTTNNMVEVNDGRLLNTNTTLKVSNNAMMDSIMNTMLNWQGEKLNFSTSGYYDYRAGEKLLAKQGLPIEWARDISDVKDENHPYPYNVNGKIKYIRIKWKMSGIWRVFYPQLQDPTNITVSDEGESASSTFTMPFDKKEDAILTHSYLINPIYRWIIDKTRVSGRVNAIISKFPNAPIEEVLTEEQLSYIKTQL